MMDDALEPATSGPTLAPASLQRIRCFLQTRGRLKVRPWAPAEQVLDALHTSLEGRRGDDEFWRDLCVLLDALGRDAVARSSAGHELIDNELLGPERVQSLLTEIRAQLRDTGSREAPFRQLTGRLSGPGAALLLLLGGATTVGCYRSHTLGSDASLADASLADTSIADSARRDTGPRDTGPADTGPADTGALDSGPVCEALAELAECSVPGDLRVQLCACIEVLNDSWQTALRQLVDRTGCNFLVNQAYCLLNACADPSATGDFDLETFLDGCSAPLYLGVRFD